MTNQVLSDDALAELEKLIAGGALLLPLRVEHWHQSLTDGGWFIKCDTDRILATVRFVPAEIESGRPALDGNAPARAIVALLNSIPALIDTVRALKEQIADRADLSPVVDADAETLVKQWIGTLQNESHVTDEDAEDLMFRVLAALTAAVDKQREVDAEIADAEFQKEYPGKDYGDLDDSAAYRTAAAIRAGKNND